MFIAVGATGVVGNTVPTDKLWIVSDVMYYWGGGSVDPVQVLCRNAAGGTFAQLGPTFNVQQPGQSFMSQSDHWRGHLVFNPGESLSFQVVGSGAADITAAGYELDATP